MVAEFGSGGGATTPFSEEIQGNTERIELMQLEARIGTFIPLSNSFELQLMVGPTVVFPDEKKTALGVDTVARVYYNETYPRPYIGAYIGVSYMTGKWEEQSTDWGFTLGPIIGTEFKINEQSSILVEYRYWHESNGSNVFGTRGPNPGYNADTAFILYMIKFGNDGN